MSHSRYKNINTDVTNISLFKGIWAQINSKRKRQLYFLFAIMVLSGFSEIITLAAVGPFIALLSNPNYVSNNKFLNNYFSFLGINNPETILLAVTLHFLIAIFISGIIRVTNLYLNSKLASSIGTQLSAKVFDLTLSQSLEVHLSQNSSELLTALGTEIYYTILGINFALQFFTNAIISLSIYIALIYLNTLGAIIAALILGTTYFLIAKNTKNRLRKLSKEIALSNVKLTKMIQEGIGSMREILLSNKKDFFYKNYLETDYRARQKLAKTQFISGFPRYTIESISLIFMSLAAFIYASGDSEGLKALPLLGAFTLGALRLLPTIQASYGSWAWITANSASISRVISLLNQPYPFKYKEIKDVKPFKLDKKLILKSVSYKYLNYSKNVLRNINLEINKGECIGIVGETGSGKSTLIDIILGLIKPTKGKLIINNKDIYKISNYKDLIGWRSSISMVPQRIYLTDSTISENIAFGESLENINLDSVKIAAECACIDDFIESTPEKYNTFIGERGIRLSGGQAQRIGIARSIYKNKDFLVLDEATSALDIRTEEKVMKSIKLFTNDISMIIIAHRLSTLKNCDRILYISNGNLVYDGEPNYILEKLEKNSLIKKD